MAKDKKSEKKVEKAAEKETAPEFKFGVQDIADEMGIKPASVRVQLRNKGIEKNGKSYGWNSKSELKEVISQLKASTAKDEDDEDEKPAKKSKKADKAEKPSKADKKAKKGKSKKSADDDDGDDDDD